MIGIGGFLLTSFDDKVATLRHEARLLGVQTSHPAHLWRLPVKCLCEELLAFVTVVEMGQDRLGPRVGGANERHIEIFHLDIA